MGLLICILIAAPISIAFAWGEWHFQRSTIPQWQVVNEAHRILEEHERNGS